MKKNISLINKTISNLFNDALRIVLKNPLLTRFIIQTMKWQRKASQIRMDWKKQGVHIPPFMIVSVTNQCNLKCKGCYAQTLRKKSNWEMSNEKLRSILEEAKELGISIILIGGGEPLLRPEILDITKHFPEIIFPLFTNGLLLNEKLLVELRNQKNIVPVLSLEGQEGDTDTRRGSGVYEHLQKVIEKISKNIFWGISLTITRTNFDTVTNEQFIKKLVDSGCKLFFFVEYVPIKEETVGWVLTEEQRKNVSGLVNSFRKKFPALFIAFPGDEQQFGGCLSAGRGFVHINSEGDIEPCPFAPYSDTNLKNMSLKEALQSNFLKTIRDNYQKLNETSGGCALWENRDWVKSLLS